MSHFTVMVIGNNPEEQLQPYHEYECTGIKDQYVIFVEADMEELQKEYEDNKEEYPSLDDFATNYHCYIKSSSGKYGKITNPNRKWDWYLLGGRWTGFLKLKDSANGKIGEHSLVSSVRAKPGYCDQALKKDIDFKGMREIAGQKVVGQFENIRRITRLNTFSLPIIFLLFYPTEFDYFILGLIGLCFVSVYIVFRLSVKSKKMNITIRILKDDLPDHWQKIFKHNLNIASGTTLKTAFEKIGKAAFIEYCQMITGSGTPSKMEDLKIERLFILIKHYFKTYLPNENEVESIFHLGSKSKNLLDSTISKNKNSLTPIVNLSLLSYLNKAIQNPDTNNYEFPCTPSHVKQMNSLITEKIQALERIKLKRNTAGIYECPVDTYDKLKPLLHG